jgi:hypothetical protein
VPMSHALQKISKALAAPDVNLSYLGRNFKLGMGKRSLEVLDPFLDRGEWLVNVACNHQHVIVEFDHV